MNPETTRSNVGMVRAASGPDFGRPLKLNERAANNIFSGWTSPSRYEPPAGVEKNLPNFFELKEPLGGNKSD